MDREEGRSYFAIATTVARGMDHFVLIAICALLHLVFCKLLYRQTPLVIVCCTVLLWWCKYGIGPLFYRILAFSQSRMASGSSSAKTTK